MTECACIDIDVEGCLAEFCSEKRRVARKLHKCTECGRIIQPKEKYEHVVGKWYDKISTYRTCFDCLSLRDNFLCGSFYYGEIKSHIYEYVTEVDGRISSECVLQLTPRARDWLLDTIQEMWDENWYEDD